MTREKSENDETRDDTRDESGEKKWREKNIAESSRDERRGGREEERKKARGEEDKTHAHAEKKTRTRMCARALLFWLTSSVCSKEAQASQYNCIMI